MLPIYVSTLVTVRDTVSNTFAAALLDMPLGNAGWYDASLPNSSALLVAAAAGQCVFTPHLVVGVEGDPRGKRGEPDVPLLHPPSTPQDRQPPRPFDDLPAVIPFYGLACKHKHMVRGIYSHVYLRLM